MILFIYVLVLSTAITQSRTPEQQAVPLPSQSDVSDGAKRKHPIPKGNPGLWANTNDYPAIALQQQVEGTTGFRVTVGPDGRVIECQIMLSSGSPDLDQATCMNVQRRARFEPALDAQGRPMSGTYANRVRWQIPNFTPFVTFPRGPVPLKSSWARLLAEDFPSKALSEKRQGVAKIEINVSSTGAVTDCKLRETSGHVDLDEASCRIASERATFGSALDVEGKPAKGRVWADLYWRIPSGNGLPAKQPPTIDLLPKAGTTQLTFVVGKDGALSGCKGQKTEGMLAGDPEVLCKIGVKQKPYVDENGQSVARRVKVTTVVEMEDIP